MRAYSFRQPPFCIFGVPRFEETGALERLPQSLAAQMKSEAMPFLARRCPGARLYFRTDSGEITLRIRLEAITPDIGMSIFSCQSGGVYIGARPMARYAGLVKPSGYGSTLCEGTFRKSGEMEDVTVYLPRNEHVTEIEILLEDGARVEAPTPYRHAKPVVFYGSSITEGGCCSKPANCYNALVSRWLDTEHYNLGFSAAALGEPAMADYIASLDMSVFVYDYDHNAPSAEYLAETHEPFFRRIRARRPELPVVMMSMPCFDYDASAAARRDVIRATFERAKAAGDRNVYFLDGERFFGDDDRDACTNDCLHPNDLGMYRIAKAVAPLLEKLLSEA